MATGGLLGALRRSGTLLALLLCAAGLLGYLHLSGKRPPPPGEGGPLLPAGALEQGGLPSADGGAAPALTLMLETWSGGRLQTSVTLRRHEVAGRGRYWLGGPSSHERADDEAGEAIFRALQGGRAARRLPGALGDGARYGLDDRGLRGRLLLPGRALRLGDEAPGELVYAAWEGERDVLLAPQQLLQLVRKDPGELRRRALLPDDLGADPASVDLGPLRIERRPSSFLLREGERHARARTEAVRAILDLLREGRPARMLAGGGLPYRGDFPDLAAPVLYRPGDVRSAPLTLRIDGVEALFYGLPCPEAADPPDGGAADRGADAGTTGGASGHGAGGAADGGTRAAPAGTIYAVRSDGARLCLRAEDAARLRPDFEALRERRLLPFPPRSVSRVRLGGMRLEGGGGRFTLDGRPVDAGAVLAYLDALGGLEGRPLPGTDRARGAGRDGPGDALVLETEQGDTVSLRALPPAACAAAPAGAPRAPGAREATCVQRDDEEPLALPAEAAPLLRPDPLRFLPRTLLAAPPTRTGKISLIRKDAPEEVAERRGGAWVLLRPVSAPADALHLGRLLTLLADLRVERWLAAAPRPGDDLGALRLRLDDRPEELRLGPPGADGCPASAGGAVGLLSREVCAALGRPLAARDLLLLDEARLQGGTFTRGGARRLLSRTERAYLLDGRPADPAPILGALRRLDRGEPVAYGPPPAGPPLLTVELRHAPLTLPATPGSSVAPPEQRLVVYRDRTRGDRLLGRLDGRDVTYALPLREADLVALR